MMLVQALPSPSGRQKRLPPQRLQKPRSACAEDAYQASVFAASSLIAEEGAPAGGDEISAGLAALRAVAGDDVAQRAADFVAHAAAETLASVDHPRAMTSGPQSQALRIEHGFEADDRSAHFTEDVDFKSLAFVRKRRRNIARGDAFADAMPERA